ncbi:MAG TPA: phage tail tube protein, partial [Telluria sp.]
CAVGEGLLATPPRVEYMPQSTGLKTLTVYYYDDGVLHKLVGAMGNCQLSAKVEDRPYLTFDVVGVDGGISAATDTGVFTPWKKPVAMTKANVIDITLGCSYAAGVLSGGTAYPSTGIEMNFGNVVEFDANLSAESVGISDRESTGSIELELTAAQEVAMMASVKANTTQGMGMTIGTVAGNKIILFKPAVQLLSPKKVDRKGKRLIGYDLRFMPQNGNDEWRIVTL